MGRSETERGRSNDGWAFWWGKTVELERMVTGDGGEAMVVGDGEGEGMEGDILVEQKA